MRTIAVAACAVAAIVAGLAVAGTASAAPKGWKCDYTQSFHSFGRRNRDQTETYSCYGRDLRATRAAARDRCNRLSGCLPGPCFPLQSPTRQYCER